ncbi:MAG: hypothetical protein KBA06_05255 [Saprospiraceae bacterium]|nr:hypothetical protein [Saprospiraceae bacterium]
MKKISILLIVLLASTIRLSAQYNSVGHDEVNNRWNVDINELHYVWYESDPSEITSFYLSIENNTAYTIVAMDVEVTLKNNGKTFFKKLCRINISQPCNPSEVQDTSQWYFVSPITRTNFGKKYSWSAIVKQVYV